MGILYKICRACGYSKPTEEFYKHATNADGLDWACKKCACARVNARRQRDPAIREKDNLGRRERRKVGR